MNHSIIDINITTITSEFLGGAHRVHTPLSFTPLEDFGAFLGAFPKYPLIIDRRSTKFNSDLHNAAALLKDNPDNELHHHHHHHYIVIIAKIKIKVEFILT